MLIKSIVADRAGHRRNRRRWIELDTFAHTLLGYREVGV